MMNAGDIDHRVLPGLQKMQKGGRFKVPAPTLTSSVQPKSNLGITTSLNSGTYKPTFAAMSKEIIKKQRQIADAEEMADRYGVIRQAEAPRSMASKAWAIMTNPMTALKYKIHGRDIPDYFDRGEKNSLDFAVNMVNPFAVVEAVKNIPGNVARGEFINAGLNALNIIPALSGARTVGKFVTGATAPALRRAAQTAGTQLTRLSKAPSAPVQTSNIDDLNIDDLRSSWGTDRWNLENHVNSTFGSPSQYKPPVINRSGLTKDELLAKAAAKEKDVVSKMSEQDFQETVLKPTGEVSSYKQDDLVNNFTGENEIFNMSADEYAEAFNSRLDLLNDMIRRNNKSGVDYTVDKLSPGGKLYFNTPKQMVPNLNKNFTEEGARKLSIFYENPGEFLTNNAGLAKLDNGKWGFRDDVELGSYASKDDAISAFKQRLDKEMGPQEISGKADWNVNISPGQWRGTVEDIANANYYKRIPGLSITGSSDGVFSDFVPRRGSGAYKSINEYLKTLDLGRVKPGFNSQTNYSRGLWEDAVKKGNAFGYYNNSLGNVYGSMKSVLPYVIPGALGAGALSQQKYGGQPCYECGGMYADGGYYDCPDQEKDPVTGKCKADEVRSKQANAANKAATTDMNAWAKQVAAMDKEIARQNAAQAAGQLTFDYDWMGSPVDKAEKKAAIGQYKQFFQQNPNTFIADDTSGYSPEQKYIIASKLKQRMSTPMGVKLVQQQFGVDPRFYDLQRLQTEMAPKMGGWNGMRNWLFNIHKQRGGPVVDSLPAASGVQQLFGNTPAPINPTIPYTTSKNPADFYKSWIQSPEYARRQLNTGYSASPKDESYNVPSASASRKTRLDSLGKIDPITYNTREASKATPGYYGGASSININPSDYIDTNRQMIEAHELGHIAGAAVNEGTSRPGIMSGREQDIFKSSMLPLKEPTLSGPQGSQQREASRRSLEDFIHSQKPQEVKADLDAVRFSMYDKGIYDIRKGTKFNELDFENARQKLGKDRVFKRLENRVGKKNFVNLMNTIAQDDNQDSYSNIAAYGGPIVDPRGQWAHPGKVTRIPSSNITMQGVPYPVYGVGSNGQEQMMQPGQNYDFGGASYVDEYPMMQFGGGTLLGPSPMIMSLASKVANYFSKPNSSGTNNGSTSDTRKSAKDLYSTPYRQMHVTFYDKNEDFYNKREANDTKKYDNSSNSINLSSGRFRGAKVAPAMINDIVNAAKANNVDPWVMLSLVGRESTFGSGAPDNFIRSGNKEDLISGWNVAEDYQPYEVDRYLADKKVPGVKVIKDSHGWNYKVEDEKAIDNYLKSNPQLIDDYYKKLESTPDLGKLDSFSLAAQRIKKKGIQNYNPGDPRYSSMVNSDMNLLKNDAALKAYMKTLGYREGGEFGEGLLSKTVSCSNCGHSWKAVDGGSDPLSCHKCGGTVKMQNGGQPDYNSILDQNAADAEKYPSAYHKDFVTGYPVANSAGSIPRPGGFDCPPGYTKYRNPDGTFSCIMTNSAPGSSKVDFSRMTKVADDMQFSRPMRPPLASIPIRKNGGLINMQGGGQSSMDSVRHQANKILQYEQLRGGPGGAPLPQYSNPKYMDMLMGKVYPEVRKIMPNASAMEAGEAMDFVFNAGFDQGTNKITKDPRAFALQEYYRQNDPSKLDADGKWAGRKNAPYSFDQEYNNTIGKLPENQRRILMNKGRDWYYKNINNPAPGVPNSNYNDTWFGRIWNTNDYQPFNPNNPNFTPKKEQGGEASLWDMIKMAQGGQHGGLDRWFAEKWVDVKTGKDCGRQEGESRAGYPACRPSKRINSQTPKTSSEMSSAEKAKFKSSKTSSQRIDYNHKRNK
jgi:hypothetical protein